MSKTLGHLLYDLYVKAVGGTSFEDKPLPEFHELGERQQNGWETAAYDFLDTFGE